MKLLITALLLGSALNTFAQDNSKNDDSQSLEVKSINLLEVLKKENPCFNDPAIERIYKSTNLNRVINRGSVFAGVTPDGDIAITYRVGGRTRLDLHLCTRSDLNGNGQVVSNPELNFRPECQVDEITVMNISLGTKDYSSHLLAFSPIDIVGTDRKSSLCPERHDEESSDGSRNTNEVNQQGIPGSNSGDHVIRD